MIIRNASVFSDKGIFEERDIYIQDGLFVNHSDGVVLEGADCFAIPGLTDIHFHGCVGYDFCDGTQEAISKIAAYQASNGVTSIVPATMTLNENRLEEICKAAKEYKEHSHGKTEAALCGINMEGPFLSIHKKGAQNADFLHNPDIAMYHRLNELSGNMIKLVDVAPETEGAMDFIKSEKENVTISLAHTSADYDTASAAFLAGASHVTHLYNAMNPFTHRAPGLVGAAADYAADVELICDGVHVHPSMVRATFKLFGKDKIILISDSMMATGLTDGKYALGGQPVFVHGNKATLADGTIAGSATNLMDCMKTAVKEMKIPLETAVLCAAVNPAKCVGIYDKYGSIADGKIANVALLSKEDLSLQHVILNGEVLF